MAHKSFYDPDNISQDDYDWYFGAGVYQQQRYSHSLFFREMGDAQMAKTLLEAILDEDARIDDPVTSPDGIECRFTTDQPIAGLNQQFILSTIRPLSHRLNQ